MNIADRKHVGLSGTVKLYTVPQGSDPLNTDHRVPVSTNNNLIVDTALDVIVGLLSKDMTCLPYYICIGNGGDIDAETGFDAGVRVPPSQEDTAIRSIVARLPIVKVDTEVVDGLGSVSYTAIAKPHQALTSSLSELTLETLNHTLISHYVEYAAPGEVRAQKHVKTSLEFLVVVWTLSLEIN